VRVTPANRPLDRRSESGASLRTVFEPKLTASRTDALQLRSGVQAVGMPTVVTHRYHPQRGPCRNLCELGDREAEELIRRLCWEHGRLLKPGYLARRRFTEAWLHREAQGLLRRPLRRCPVYFFLGDFSHGFDPSRPASLQRALAALAAEEQLTLTLGDSMTVAAQPNPQLYNLEQVGRFSHRAWRQSSRHLTGAGFERLLLRSKSGRKSRERLAELQGCGMHAV